MNTPVIQLRDLAKICQTGDVAVRAVRGVTLDIARGEFVAVMGASGSGKSTLRRQQTLRRRDLRSRQREHDHARGCRRHRETFARRNLQPLAHRRWHRHREHHARERDRARARNRHPYRRRRAAVRDSAPVPPEAITLSLLGGLVGVLLGIAISQLVGSASTFQPIVTADSIVLAFGVSFAIGVFFGFYPARKAAALDPIDALRYE